MALRVWTKNHTYRRFRKSISLTGWHSAARSFKKYRLYLIYLQVELFIHYLAERLLFSILRLRFRKTGTGASVGSQDCHFISRLNQVYLELGITPFSHSLLLARITRESFLPSLFLLRS